MSKQDNLNPIVDVKPRVGKRYKMSQQKDRPDREKIVQGVIDWLKPYLKKEYGVGCYFTDTEIVEWVICDEYGDAIDAPNYTLEPKEEL